MKTYAVYFEIFGKKMKTDVLANSEEEAKTAIRNKVIFHKVEEIDIKSSSIEDLFGFFNWI